MPIPPIKFIEKKVRENLSHRRAHHCFMVAKLARELARLHHWDPEKAYRAGLLHDWAKEWSPAKLKLYVSKKRIAVPLRKETVSINPNLLHAYVGAAVIKENGWITDAPSLRAISAHTLGRIPMSLADKIIYVADIASKDRKFSGAKKIRKIARQNIHKGFAAGMALKLSDQARRKRKIHPFAVSVWNHEVVQA